MVSINTSLGRASQLGISKQTAFGTPATAIQRTIYSNDGFGFEQREMKDVFEGAQGGGTMANSRIRPETYARMGSVEHGWKLDAREILWPLQGMFGTVTATASTPAGGQVHTYDMNTNAAINPDLFTLFFTRKHFGATPESSMFRIEDAFCTGLNVTVPAGGDGLVEVSSSWMGGNPVRHQAALTHPAPGRPVGLPSRRAKVVTAANYAGLASATTANPDVQTVNLSLSAGLAPTADLSGEEDLSFSRIAGGPRNMTISATVLVDDTAGSFYRTQQQAYDDNSLVYMALVLEGRQIGGSTTPNYEIVLGGVFTHSEDSMVNRNETDGEGRHIVTMNLVCNEEVSGPDDIYVRATVEDATYPA